MTFSRILKNARKMSDLIEHPTLSSAILATAVVELDVEIKNIRRASDLYTSTMDVARIEEYIRQQQEQLNNENGGGNASDDDFDNQPAINELRQLVAKWSDIDKSIKHIRRVAAAWSNIKTEHERRIVEIMKEHDIEGLNTKDAIIQCVTKTRKKRVTKDKMKRAIETCIHDDDVRKNVMRLVLNEEPVMTLPRVALKKIQIT